MKTGSRFNSGAFRFALLIGALFAAVSVLLLGAVERAVVSYTSEATTAGLRSETEILVRELPDGGRSELIDTINRRQTPTADQLFRYLLTARDGARLAGDLPIAARRLGRGQVRFREDRPRPGDGGHLETLETLGTQLPDGTTLVVATDTYDIYKLQNRLTHFTIWSGVLATVLALIGGYIISGIFLQRLERVNGAIARIMAGDLSERLPKIGMAPEFDRLSLNLNLMLDRMNDLMEGLRQVSTDIAHDLRTPLTRLRQQLESMQEATSVECLRKGAESALTQTESILAIFRALLRIGIIEAGEAKQLFGAVDLSEIADRMAQFYRPTAEDDFKVILTSVQPGQIVTGDGEMLAQLFANLLDNAIKYTPGGTTISVSVRGEPGAVVASVADDGPGIPIGEREKVFRRFYRIDASRHAPGAGLGLSLVQAIAKLHEATFTLDSNEPGLRAILTFSVGATMPATSTGPTTNNLAPASPSCEPEG